MLEHEKLTALRSSNSKSDLTKSIDQVTRLDLSKMPSSRDGASYIQQALQSAVMPASMLDNTNHPVVSSKATEFD